MGKARQRRLMFAAGALLGLEVCALSVLAQQPELLFNVYENDDTVHPSNEGLQRLADAVRGTQRPDRCALGELKIVQPREGYPLWSESVAQARRDNLLAELDRRGLNVAGRLFAVIDTESRLGKSDVTYTAARDDKPPTLRTTSDPQKGSKVQPGQRIVVRLIARDDADRWQTGIKTVQLVADSDDGRFIVSENYEACSDPNEKRVEATYVVPANPPPIVRLTALAEDHAGLMDKDTAEFPTGEWYGTFTYPAGQPPHQHTTRADLVLNHDGKGNLTGAMVGETRFVDASTAPGCFTSTVTPHRFRVALTGAYTEGRSIKVFLGDIQDTPMILNNRCPTYNTTDPVPQLSFKNYVGLGWDVQQPFLGTPSPLGDGDVLPDGTREYKHSNVTGTMTVTLRRARN